MSRLFPLILPCSPPLLRGIVWWLAPGTQSPPHSLTNVPCSPPLLRGKPQDNGTRSRRMLAAATALTSSPSPEEKRQLPSLSSAAPLDPPVEDLPAATEDKQGEPLAGAANPGQTREANLDMEGGGGAPDPAAAAGTTAASAAATGTTRPGDGGEAPLHLSDRPGSYWALAAAQEASCSAASQGQEGAVMWGQCQLGALAEELTSQCPVRRGGGGGEGCGAGDSLQSTMASCRAIVHSSIGCFCMICLPLQICLCDFESGDMLRQLPCKHEFHQPCIDSWMDRHRTCPLCRHVLWEEDGQSGNGQSGNGSGP